MMGQKINSTGLRLKKKINWRYNFSVHNFLNYSQTLFDINQTDNAVFYGLKRVNFLCNDMLIYKNSKKKLLYSRVLNYKKTTRNLSAYLNSNRVECANDILEKSKNFLFNFNQLQLTVADTYYNKKKDNFVSYILNKTNIITPSLIANYIANYLDKNIKNKLNLPNQNLQVIITRFLDLLLQFNKHGVIGIKIICSGKWKKTRSGRKQSFVIQRGLLQKSSYANNIFYDYIAQKTKFGMCGVKVWIALKSNKKSNSRF